MADRIDPYRNFRFKVKIDGINIAAFADVTVADSTTEAIEYREGTDLPTGSKQLSGLTKYGSITLKRGITDSMDLYKWRKQVEDTGAQGARKNISIILVDEAGAEKSQWDIVAAWPTKYTPGELSAKGNDVFVETFELVHEGIKRTK
jgi:phage tail-like protein